MERWVMKLFTGWIVSAGLVFTAATANAQGLPPVQIAGSPYTAVSDVSGPYAAVMPPEAPPPDYGPRYYEPSYGTALLPPQEVYAVLRDNGFSPLGIPRLRGLFYVIGVIDRGGEDGRLVIDARNGRVLRFTPAYRVGSNTGYNENAPRGYGPAGVLPPISEDFRGAPRPPVAVPQMASRTPMVPLPKASPPHAADIKPDAKPLAAKPALAPPAQQSAAVQAKPAETPIAHPPAAVPIVEAKPSAPEIKPTQEMPKAQGLE
jgi:hypothetical protein